MSNSRRCENPHCACRTVPVNLDDISVEKQNLEGIVRVRKKPIIVHAVQCEFPFIVMTKEGVMTGKPGDYLMFGIDGEKYPCDKNIFDRTYDVLED